MTKKVVTLLFMTVIVVAMAIIVPWKEAFVLEGTFAWVPLQCVVVGLCTFGMGFMMLYVAVSVALSPIEGSWEAEPVERLVNENNDEVILCVRTVRTRLAKDLVAVGRSVRAGKYFLSLEEDSDLEEDSIDLRALVYARLNFQEQLRLSEQLKNIRQNQVAIEESYSIVYTRTKH